MRSQHIVKNLPACTLPSLTSMRAFAAIFVAIHHTRNSWAHFTLVTWISQIGWLGVTFFFVLSGFVLMWSFDPAMPNGQFVLRRLTRIYPLHAICLGLSLTAFYFLRNPLAGYVGTPWGTVANFFLLQDWIPGHPNIRQAWNGVSWTLSCEFMFYLAAPFLFTVLNKITHAGLLVLFLFTLSSISMLISFLGEKCGWSYMLDFLSMHPIPRFIEFALGASGAMLLRSGWSFRSRSTAVAAMIIPVGLYFFWIQAQDDKIIGSIFIPMFMPGAFLLIISSAWIDIEGRMSWMRHRTLVFFGEISFALYMIHALLLGLFAPVMQYNYPLLANITDCFTVLYLIFAIFIAVIMHLFFEVPVRAWMMRRFGLHWARGIRRHAARSL